MNIEPHPSKNRNIEDINHGIISFHDDMLKWKDKKSYDKRWQKRCDNCLSQCCLVEPGGRFYDYLDDYNISDKEESKKLNMNLINAKDIFCKMPIIWCGEFDFDERLAPDDLSKVRLCVLAIDGKCIIYETRPKMCKIYKCILAQYKYLGVK